MNSAPAGRRPAAKALPSIPCVAAGMLILAALWFQWGAVRKGYWVDLDVYVRGAEALWRREDLYSVTVHDLPFTYSPFAAALFLPSLPLPTDVVRVVFSAASLACYVVVVVVIARRLRMQLVPAVLVALAGAALEPFRFNLTLGQVNLFLLLLVVLDCLVVPIGRRGCLVGLAAGIKIIPGVFVLFFLLKRDWRSAVRAGIWFAVTVAVGFVASPDASWRYWSGGFFKLGKWGSDTVAGPLNQSLHGIWLRMAGSGDAPAAVTLALCVVGVGIGALVARRLMRLGNDVGAVLALAVGALLGSPISWSHHWLWVVPVLLLLVAQGRYVWAWVLGACFWIGPLNWLGQPDPSTFLHMSLADQVGAAQYVLAGAMVLVILGSERAPGHAESSRSDAEAPTAAQELAVS